MNIQLETFTPLFGKLRGPTKWIAKRIIGPDLVDAINAIPNKDGVVNSNDAIKNLIGLAARKVTSGIGRKIAVAFTVVLGIIGIIATTVTHLADGNFIIPTVIFAILIIIPWFVTTSISKRSARKISEMIFKAIEDKTAPVEG
jgi:Flp pilus assembly protein TadB